MSVGMALVPTWRAVRRSGRPAFLLLVTGLVLARVYCRDSYLAHPDRAFIMRRRICDMPVIVVPVLLFGAAVGVTFPQRDIKR
ncbi:hypothetical protein KCP77_19135 [Salmonella enterica subsp. enterica]|nr:hypothetical protein KCP77_19135 [Salmonella enterica subsp. enterica]